MVKKFAIGAVRLVSMAFRSFGWRACRFHPTCSAYCEESFNRFGGLKAAAMTLWRFLRCQPFSRGGFDPVPEN